MKRNMSFALVVMIATALTGCDQKSSSTAAVQKQGAIPDISKMSDAEIDKLPRDVLERIPVGIMFSHYRDGSMAGIMQMQISAALGSLSYFDTSDDQMRAAIRKFQKDIGHEETGDLTTKENELLQARSTFVKSLRVNVIGGGWDKIDVFSYQNGFISTNGTWVLDGEKLAYPVNSAQISCTKSEATCVVHQVDIDIPNLSDRGFNSDSYSVYQQLPESYDILSWSESEVVSESVGTCRTTTMTINSASKEAFQVTRNNGGNCELGTVKFPKLERPRVARLVASGKTINEFWNERQKQANKLISSEASARIDDAIKKMTAYEEAQKKK